ncbi:hypothetical protein KBTX_04449 [wastewater metagenome]|uniref:Uncharacterized protein n=2 Tax=unclassified sequences TaxID=12908 RepID=A0A5B8RG85_9ZZZZ|nr:hypothetical protein KBTEX_04449 [uncultured organism]
MLNEAHRPLQYKFSHLNMIFRCFIKRRTDDIPVNRAFDVRHLFGAFIDKQHDQLGIRMIGRHTVGNIFKEHRFSCLWR